MLFMVVCAVGFGWLGKKLDETRREQVIVAKVKSWEGWVEYHDITGPHWITRHFRRVQEASICNPYVGTERTDDDLRQLTGLTRLEALDLRATPVTDVGLVYLSELTCIKELKLGVTRVTDAGLENLKGLTNLRVLELDYTRVTDAGLAHLKELPNLERLCIWNTQVTDEGVEKLQKSLPDCDITH